MEDKYLIRNGILLSIMDGSEQRADILVEKGIITGIAPSIKKEGIQIIDAGGCYVSVGWLDAHCHFARQGDPVSLDPEEDILRQGVTYAIDMGTLGPEDYSRLHEIFSPKNRLRALCYLNIGRKGVSSSRPMDFEDPGDIDPEMVADTVKKYRSEILGLKARIDEKFCFDPVYVMDRLRELGDRLEMPVAVHAPRSLIGLDRLLPYLKNGDILCHTLAGNSPAMDIVDEKGNIRSSVLQARERGVIFDLSHGTNAFSYAAAEAAWEAGFLPDTLSSDLHGRNLNGPVYNLGTVLARIRGITGLPWWQILNKTIAKPVCLQHIPGKNLQITEGEEADLTVFRMEEGDFSLPDSRKETRIFREMPTAVYTCKGKEIRTCRDRRCELVQK